MRVIRWRFPSTKRGGKFILVGVCSLLSPRPMGCPSHMGKKKWIPLYKEG